MSESESHRIMKEFSVGVGGKTPSESTVEMVGRVADAVFAKTKQPEYSVDEEDGAFSFEALTSDGLLLMCEISMSGEINFGLYESAVGRQVAFLARSSEAELVARL